MKLKWKVFLAMFVAGISIYIIFQGLVHLYVIVPWTVPWVGDIIIPNPPKPEVTYGEFPFRLIYELDGETKVIRDTVICEFDGFERHGEAGKYRKWKYHLKSGDKHVTLLNVAELKIEDRWGNQILELYFHPGNAEYYMDDDVERKKIFGEISNMVSYTYQANDGSIGFSAFPSDEVENKYKIRLITWEPSPPIKNTFK